MKTFKDHSEIYLTGLASNKYGLLITKYCGYEFFVVIHKNATLNELYRHIELETGNSKFTLYIEKEEIPKTCDLLSNYIVRQRNNKLLEPIFKMPNPVVYRIMIDDGNKH